MESFVGQVVWLIGVCQLHEVQNKKFCDFPLTKRSVLS